MGSRSAARVSASGRIDARQEWRPLLCGVDACMEAATVVVCELLAVALARKLGKLAQKGGARTGLCDRHWSEVKPAESAAVVEAGGDPRGGPAVEVEASSASGKGSSDGSWSGGRRAGRRGAVDGRPARAAEGAHVEASASVTPGFTITHATTGVVVSSSSSAASRPAASSVTRYGYLQESSGLIHGADPGACKRAASLRGTSALKPRRLTVEAWRGCKRCRCARWWGSEDGGGA